MPGAIPHRKKCPPSRAAHISDIIVDVMHCIWPFCPFQATQLLDLEKHAVDVHKVNPAVYRLPIEERHVRGMRLVSRWAMGLPEVLEGDED